MPIRSLLELILRTRKEGDAAKKTAEELRRFRQEVKESDAALKPLHDSAKKAGLALSALGVAGTAFIGSATKLAARVETLGVVTVQLGENVGKTEDEIRSLEQAIVDQGITLQSTRTAIAKMIQANIDLEHSTKLARLAQDAAVIGNINSSEAFEHLINVIVTGNVRMGRTIGLQLQFGDALQRTADQLGKNVDELTDTEITMSRTHEVLDQGVTIAGAYEAAMETAGKQVLSLDRHIEESRRIIGEAYLPLFAGLVAGITDVLKAFQDLSTVQQRGIATTLGMVTVWSSVLGAGLILIPMINNLKNSLIALGIASHGSLGPLGLLIGLITTLSTILVVQKAKTKAAIEGFKDIQKQVKLTGGDFEEYKKLLMESIEGTQLQARAQDMATRAHIDYEEALWRVLLAEGAVTEEHWKLSGSTIQAKQDVFELNKMVRESRDPLGAYTTAISEARSASDRYHASLPKVKQELLGISTAAGFAGSSIDLNLTGSIGRFLDEIEFFRAGGMEIQLAFQKVKTAIEEGKISREEGQEYLEALFVAATDLQTDLGDLTAKEAAENISSQLGVTFDEAVTKIQNVDAELDKLVRTIDILIRIRTEGIITPGGQVGQQHGGSYILRGPPGVDKVPVFFMGTAGERVDITPRGQVAPGGGGGLNILGDINISGASGDPSAMVDEFLAELGRRQQQANASGMGYIGI